MYVCSYLTYYVSRYKGGRTTLKHVVSQPDRKSKIRLDKFMEVANTFKMSHQPPFYYKWLSHKVSDKIVFLKKTKRHRFQYPSAYDYVDAKANNEPVRVQKKLKNRCFF